MALTLSGYKPAESIKTVALQNVWGLFFRWCVGMFLPQTACAADWQYSRYVVMQLRLPQHAEPLLINLRESKGGLPAPASLHSRRTWRSGQGSAGQPAGMQQHPWLVAPALSTGQLAGATRSAYPALHCWVWLYWWCSMVVMPGAGHLGIVTV